MYEIKQSILAAEFRCLAEKCPSTCCAGWSVIWTSEEISKLKKSSSGELLEMCNKAFPHYDDYTPVQMNEDGFCPFLCDGLCSVQRELGEEYLSYTCREYPRLTQFDGKNFLRSCRSACYAVAERLISDDNCMKLIQTTAENTKLTAIISTTENAEDKNISEITEQLLWDDSISISETLIKSMELYNINENGNTKDLNDVFGDIFGWKLILPDKDISVDTEMIGCCKKAVTNIVRSMYLEWRIKGRTDGISFSDDYCSFLFRTAAVVKAAIGASFLVSAKEELICTIADLTGAMFSERSISADIAAYLKVNDLNNKKYISHIL